MTLSSQSSALNHKSAVGHCWRRAAEMNHLLAPSPSSFFKAQRSQSLSLPALWKVWHAERVRARTHVRMILNCNRCQTPTHHRTARGQTTPRSGGFLGPSGACEEAAGREVTAVLCLRLAWWLELQWRRRRWWRASYVWSLISRTDAPDIIGLLWCQQT